ncbi:MAG: hypothetical protein ACKOA8_02800 [Deltaproteobacteria bacterium]
MVRVVQSDRFFVLSLFLIAASTSTLSFAINDCKILMECTGGSAKACALRFKAAQRIINKGTGAQLLDQGLKLDIPESFVEGLTEAFIKDYKTAAETPGNSPAAKGNVGHMKDHFNFIDAHEAKFRELGIDIPSLKLAMAAHDIGKGRLDEGIAKYITEKAKGSKQELAPFLRDFILSHELHSIAGIPRVVKEHLNSQGIDVDSPAGKAQIQKYSEQIMEAIRLHNGVDVTGDLKAKYPTLTPEEVEQVQKAWWPENYKKFARDLGLKNEEYGGETNPIGYALNFIDRATLASPSAPAKLMAQRLGTMSWGLELVEDSTTTAAKGNIAQIKAQGFKLEQMAQSESQKQAAEAVTAAGQKLNSDMIALGTTLKNMNVTAKLENIPVDPGTLIFQRGDGKWIRINGQNKAEAFIEIWDVNNKEFKPENKPASPTSPVDLLMEELRQKDVWPRK